MRLNGARLRKIHDNDPLLVIGKRRITPAKLPVSEDGLFLSDAAGNEMKILQR